MLQTMKRANSMTVMIPIVVLAALFGATMMYLALPCGASAAGTGPNCTPMESLKADVIFDTANAMTPTLFVRVTEDESNSDQYVLYVREPGDDSWVEMGRLPEGASQGFIRRADRMRDGVDYDYRVVGFENGVNPATIPQSSTTLRRPTRTCTKPSRRPTAT